MDGSAVFSVLFGIFATVGLLLLLATLYLPVYYLSALKKRKKPPKASKNNAYGYIICARNESEVISNVILSIFNQKYPKELMKVFVVADNCTDNTAELAREAGAIVYERFNKEKVGKGYAMQYIFEKLKTDPQAADLIGYFVFDADNLLSPYYTEKMNDAIDNGARIATAYRDILDWKENWLASCYGFYFIREYSLMNMARNRFGVSAQIMGTGWYLSKEILKKDNGWSCFCLTEDMEFSLKELLDGEQAVFCEDAVFFDEQVVTWKQSLLQRQRWAKGHFQCLNMYGKQLFTGLIKERKWAFYDYLMTMLQLLYLPAIGLVNMLLSFCVMLFMDRGIGEKFGIMLIVVAAMTVFFILVQLLPMLLMKKHIRLPVKLLIPYLASYLFFILSFYAIGVSCTFKNRKVVWNPIDHGSNRNN